MAHEFRTPLTLILNPLDEIQKKIIHVSGVEEDLLLIRRNAKRLLTLVNDLRDLRKIENGKGNWNYLLLILMILFRRFITLFRLLPGKEI